MESTKNYFLLFMFLVLSWSTQGQSEIKSYALKKGQAFDIIFLRNKQGTEEIQKKYFESAYPIALEMGYGPLKGFSIKENPLQGNYHPQAMILGTWSSIDVRQNFLNDIEISVPDFHSMRKEIWSSFYLTYWEMEEDLTFQINPSKFNIVTAYWGKENSSLEKFKIDWLKKSKDSKGKNILVLNEGTSPFGYQYNPDFIVITEWESKAEYDSFYKESLKLDRSSIKQVHEFII